jgi:hypothetical protein
MDGCFVFAGATARAASNGGGVLATPSKGNGKGKSERRGRGGRKGARRKAKARKKAKAKANTGVSPLRRTIKLSCSGRDDKVLLMVEMTGFD